MSGMIDPFNGETSEQLGTITEADLTVLEDGLEEESADGRAAEHLIALLRTAVGSGDGVEIRWRRR
jgi:hypothetical protein